MSRSSRKVLDTLEKLAKDNGMGIFLIPSHVYTAEMLVCKYFEGPVINIIRSKLKNIPKNKRNLNHYTITYWKPVIEKMLSKQAHTKRPHHDDIHTEPDDYTNFNYLTTKFVLTDYSIDEAIMVNKISNEFSLKDIIKACDIARSNESMNIAYINGILQKQKAADEFKKGKLQDLADKSRQSDEILNKQKVYYDEDSVDEFEKSYEEKRNDMLLEMLLEKMTGGNDDGN